MPAKDSHTHPRLPVHLVIFFTGFTFLLYEVSWNRLLSLVLGATVTASTIVLATFMAGFGIGAFFWGRLANHRKAVGPILGALLAGVGIFSGINYFILTKVVPGIYASMGASGSSMGLVEVFVFSLAVVLLFIPAFLMGGVFPLVSKLAVSSNDTMASVLGRLYAVETLGSTIGGLLTGFVLLGAFGQMRTIMAAAGVNLLLAAWVAFDPSFRLSHADNQEGNEEKEEKKTSGKKVGSLQKSALLGAFICGLSILSLQILWMRMFRIYLTNTSYTFALVSSVAIMGLFAGSAWYSRRRKSAGGLPRTMVWIIMGMMVSTTLGLWLLLNLPEVLMFPFASVMGSPMARALILPFVAALLIIFPPSLFSGFAFPLACRMYAEGTGNVSRDVGLVLMVNTIGSVVGPLTAAFVLLPLLGATMSVLLVVALLGVAALLILRMGETSEKSETGMTGDSRYVRGLLYSAVSLLLIIVIVSPDWRILPPSFSRFDRNILYYQESVEGTLTVGQDTQSRMRSKYTFVNNSAVIGSTYDAVKVVKMVGHFPFLLGLECKDVLVIGFGIGVTTSAIASHDEVKSIECVELVPGLRKAAQYYEDLNHGIVDDPRLKIIPGDGRHYLQTLPRKYDLISCDPTHPILGSGSLYTANYFEQCRDHLNPGGMVSQYLPLHKLRTEEFLGIIKTFESVFPNSTVWLGHYHAVLLGGLDPLPLDFAVWEENVKQLSEDGHFYIDAYHLAATLMLDGATIAELGASSAINTDDKSYTEFFNPDCLLENNIGLNLKFLMQSRSDIGTIFKDIPQSDLMERYLEGNRLLTASLYHKLERNSQRSLELLQKAVKANPEDQEFPFLIKLYY
jgi:spermidine synthase